MSDSIGARLRAAREARRLTIEQVSEATKLRPHYLQALETDDFTAIPSAAQARGFLRLYAEFLELDMVDLVPPAPVQPAPVAPVAAAPSVAPRPAAPASFLTSLIKRFSRAKESDAAQDSPASAPVGDVPEPPHEAVAPATSEAQTARRPRPDPTEVKKNALGE